jgi:ketosteroid isomerase-like protein
MRERNVEIVRAAIAAFNRGDIEALLELAAPDVEVVSPEELPNGGRFVGPNAWLAWMTTWMEAWDEFKVEVIAIEAVDDRNVVVDIRQIGRGKGSGIEIDMPMIYLCEVGPDGRFVRYQLHLTRDAALAEV